MDKPCDDCKGHGFNYEDDPRNACRSCNGSGRALHTKVPCGDCHGSGKSETRLNQQGAIVEKCLGDSSERDRAVEECRQLFADAGLCIVPAELLRDAAPALGMHGYSELCEKLKSYLPKE